MKKKPYKIIIKNYDNIDEKLFINIVERLCIIDKNPDKINNHIAILNCKVFGLKDDKKMNNNFIFNNIVHLTLDNKFNEELKENTLPKRITHLTFGHFFNQEIKENVYNNLSHLPPDYTLEEAAKTILNKEDFERWVSNKLVSPYYVVLSDFAQKYVSNFRYDLYRPSITPEIEEFYKKEFKDDL